MIEIKEVIKKYKRNKEELLVLDNVSYSFNNQIYGIIGESGAGKSTLIKCILGIEKINRGHIIVNNRDITKMSIDELANYRNKDIGYIPQNDALFENLTAEENVIIPALRDNDNVETHDILNKVFESLGITDNPLQVVFYASAAETVSSKEDVGMEFMIFEASSLGKYLDDFPCYKNPSI